MDDVSGSAHRLLLSSDIHGNAEKGDNAIAGSTTSSAVQIPKSRGALITFVQEKSLLEILYSVFGIREFDHSNLLFPVLPRNARTGGVGSERTVTTESREESICLRKIRIC